VVLLIVGFVMIALSIAIAWRIARIPADQPLPDHSEYYRSVMPPLPPEMEIARYLSAIIILGLGGFGVSLWGGLQLAHLVPRFP
jgi:multisubunit Na+/H+ antiporter MnhB subunit